MCILIDIIIDNEQKNHKNYLKLNMKIMKPDWPAGDVEAIQLVESLLGLLSFGECYEGVTV